MTASFSVHCLRLLYRGQRFVSVQCDSPVFLHMPRRWLVTTHGGEQRGACVKSRLLLAHNAHPSASASDGFCAMLETCGRSHRTVDKLFIDHDATVTLAPGSTSPFLMSCFYGHADLTTLLLKHRTSASQAKSDGFSPLRRRVKTDTPVCLVCSFNRCLATRRTLHGSQTLPFTVIVKWNSC